LLYHLAEKHFNRRVSLIAGVLMAFYGTFIFYDATFLPVTLNTFLALYLLLWISNLYQETKESKWFIPGVLLALASNTHQTVLIYILAIPVKISWIISNWPKINSVSIISLIWRKGQLTKPSG
jgi:4-amino-4-deoxy-L-arabinose transferase-like glycosyltransferase